MAKLEEVIQRGTTVAQPAANTVPVGTLYYDTTLSKLERSTGAAWEDCEGVGGGAGSDTTAIHDNTASEISAIAEKAVPIAADMLIIEDSAAANAKKMVLIGNLPAGAGGATIWTTAYAAPPAAAAGDLWLPNNSFYVLRYTGAAWEPWGPIFPMTPPVSGDFAWVNQGGASVDVTNGGVYLLSPAAGGTSLHIRKKAAPAPPYTITVAMIPSCSWWQSPTWGIGWRQSADGKMATMAFQISTFPYITVYSCKYTNETTVSAVYGGGSTRVLYQSWPLFCRIADDNVNRIISYSFDGIHFDQILHTVGRADFLTADEVLFYAYSDSVTYPMGLQLLSWKEA